MEKPRPPILPPGLFRTSDEVYQEVANYPIVPLEKLHEYWQVYTTTFKELEDPTASRLEAFWWHVMGSDRRFLSGKTLAKMYEDISKGTSFVPLRGPANRFHVSVPRILQGQVSDMGYGTNTQPENSHGQAQTSQGPVEVPKKSTAEKHTTKDSLASSSSRPPPPHPILKKSRGPSTSGPRPTARFVSPHDSEDEAAKENDTSSGSTAAAGMHMRRTVKSPVKGEKKSTPTGRKFTASSAAKRHSRPGLTRRPSSQSSVDTSSTKASLARNSTGGRSGSVEHAIADSLASSGTSNLSNTPGLSAKAAGKRPMRTGAEETRHTDRTSAPTAQVRMPPVIVQQRQEPVQFVHAPSIERRGSSPLRNFETVEGRSSTVKPGPPRTHLEVGSPGGHAAPMMARSQSNIETQRHRPRESHLDRPLPLSMITPKSTPVAAQKAPAVAVQVQFDSETVTAQGGGGIAEDRDLPDSITIASRPSTSSLYTPTQPSPTPAPFLGRSKSQLTLLLEKMDQGKPKSTRAAKGKSIAPKEKASHGH